MNFYDKVNNLCKKRGISISALAVELGYSKGTPTGWKTLSKPRAANIKKIADYFGVPVSYFLEGEADETAIFKESDKKIKLSPKEEQLLEMVKTLSDDELDMLTVFITTLLNARK